MMLREGGGSSEEGGTGVTSCGCGGSVLHLGDEIAFVASFMYDERFGQSVACLVVRISV